jgi:hypothetical protein
VALHLRPTDACALHYRHTATSITRQLNSGKTVTEIALARARGFTCSVLDPVTGGKVTARVRYYEGRLILSLSFLSLSFTLSLIFFTLHLLFSCSLLLSLTLSLPLSSSLLPYLTLSTSFSLSQHCAIGG